MGVYTQGHGEFWCILGGILCDLELQESES